VVFSNIVYVINEPLRFSILRVFSVAKIVLVLEVVLALHIALELRVIPNNLAHLWIEIWVCDNAFECGNVGWVWRDEDAIEFELCPGFDRSAD
jgi:hypothetical protein